MKLLQIKKPSPLAWLILLHVFIVLLAVLFLVRQKGEPAKVKEKILVIPIEGVISFDQDSLRSGLSVNSIVDTLEKAREKDEIKAVVLRINSPGGSVGAVQEIYRALKKFKQKGKFVVSSFEDIAASGGYYVACAGDSIVSNPGALTGSIGVLMQLPSLEGLLQKVGVTVQTIKSGSMKDAGSPFRQLSQEEKQYFGTLIMDAYDQFFTAVKEGRKLNDAALKPLADGRVFIGRIAKEKKLVDELGGLEEAIEKAKKLAGLEGKKPEIIFKKEEKTLEKLLRLLSASPLETLRFIPHQETQILYLFQ
ncbi:MAG: signal peptide peptidase SppA [Elusimicrobia bacterium]|nr:signal peptide peptidase SppA [Candidatus Obscuribacterium magneticum]